MYDYSSLPEHLREGARRYVEEGTLPGGFLQAVVCNDLMESFGRADSISKARMSDIVNFFCNKMPVGCRGSEKKMHKWIERIRVRNASPETPPA